MFFYFIFTIFYYLLFLDKNKKSIAQHISI